MINNLGFFLSVTIWECFSQIPNCRTSACVFWNPMLLKLLALKADLHILPFIGNIEFFWWWLWFKSILIALPLEIYIGLNCFYLTFLSFLLFNLSPFLLPFSLPSFLLCLLSSFCPSIRIRLVSRFAGSLKFFQFPSHLLSEAFPLIHFLCISFLLVICFPEDLDKHLDEPYDKHKIVTAFGEQCWICDLRRRRFSFGTRDKTWSCKSFCVAEFY